MTSLQHINSVKIVDDAAEQLDHVLGLDYDAFNRAMAPLFNENRDAAMRVEAEAMRLVGDAVSAAFKAGWFMRTDATALLFEDNR